MKTPNFENDFYLSTWNYLIKTHGNKNVYFNEKTNVIKVNLSCISYFLIISYNENKIYFQNNDPEVNQNLSFEDYKKLDKSFRIFDFSAAKKYIDFKNQECNLIQSIQG
jgi:hypothetical protein